MQKNKFIDIKKHLNKYSIEVVSNVDDQSIFNNINSILKSQSDDLSFFSNIKYKDQLKNIKAKACLIKNDYTKFLPKSCEPIIVEDPYFAFASLTQLFFKNKTISNGIISKHSIVNSKCKLHNNIQIDPFSILDDNTEIMENVIIGSNSKIGPNVIISNNCIIHDNVSISNSIIKDNCEIKSGARIGGSGFGFEEKSKLKITHHGNVVINKNSTIGSNTTIDRAVFETTSIGENSQIDNLVQIAHNVIIGKHAIIAAQVGIAGSTKIGDFVKIGGQAGISGHLTIGNNVTIAGKSGVTKNINDNKVIAGFPAKDISDWKRELIKLSKL